MSVIEMILAARRSPGRSTANPPSQAVTETKAMSPVKRTSQAA